MDSKTKIVVLHTKELIYTAVFALLCILLIVLLFVMFGPGHTDKKQNISQTVYTWYLHIHPHTEQHKSGSGSICGQLQDQFHPVCQPG